MELIMKVKELIAALQQYNQDAEVKTHRHMGNPALFVCQDLTDTNIDAHDVWIADKNDIDIRAEIDYRIDENCGRVNKTFFKELEKKTGITLDDIKEYYPEIYDAAKKYYKN